MNDPCRSFRVQFGLAALGYVLVLLGSQLFIAHHPTTPDRYVIALLPVIPMCAALVAMRRFIASVDELQRRIQLDAFAVAAATTGLVTFTYALLVNVGAPQIGFEWVLPFTMMVWGVSVVLARRRYAQ